jgi:hypothetical protein
MPHTPSPRPHLLRYVASRGIPLQCIDRAERGETLKSKPRERTRGSSSTIHNDRTLCVHISLHAVSQVTTRTRSCGVALSLALTLALASCESLVNEVRVDPGTAPLKPVFVLSDTGGRGPAGTIYGLSVVACGSETVLWQIAASGSHSAPSRIEYGVAPTGYTVNTGPVPLRAGCYNVYVTDGRRARFRVDAAGHITTDPRRDTVIRRDSARG